MFLDKIISNIESNPDKKFLTICNSEKNRILVQRFKRWDSETHASSKRL